MSLSLLAFFAIIFVLVYMLRVARIGALVAFLLAGVLSGPYVFNFFQLSDTWTFLGDLGILFLWFNIGLEINMRRLWRMRRTIFGFGATQVLMVAIMLFPLLFGFTQWTVTGCIMVALMLAMSSTSADLQLLTDRNQLNTEMGRKTFSILLFQDLLSIPLLAMLPAFSGATISMGATAIDVVVISLALILSVIVIGRFVMTPVFRHVGKLKSKEAFLLAIMLNIIIWAALVEIMGLPAGLGAFLAGMLMSETVYRHQITAEISPYATLFLAFFFISLGMGLNLPLLGANWYIILFGLIGFMVIKFAAIFIVSRVRGVNVQDSFMIALILAQGGEFALLMLQTMKTSGIRAIPSVHEEILTAIIILSIMVTPLLLWLHDYLQRSGRISFGRAARNLERPESSIRPDVIVCGFGRVGQTVCQMLDAQNIPYLAIDLDINAVMMGRDMGFNVVYGNTTNRDVLVDLGLRPRGIKSVVIALDNVSTARQTILTVKTIVPRVKIFARARNLADAKVLMSLGVAAAMPETIESSLFLGYSVLDFLGVPEQRTEKLLSEIRSDDYACLSAIISDKHD
ncbi:MAG: cation:proton antiporter [Alphaproteobacteria bacterium]|nr:cation:proton antiporter [Alphaproteobacteria bacterium]